MNWWKKIYKRSWTIPIVRLDGVIGSSGQFGGGGLTDYNLASVLEKTFKMSRIKAVALVVNSPGGSPTQSSLIAARIKRLAKENNVIAVMDCGVAPGMGNIIFSHHGSPLLVKTDIILDR